MFDIAESMLSSMEDYYWRMAGRNRLIGLYAGDHILGVCTFFVLTSWDDLGRFYPRKIWSIPEDAQDGELVYFDKLVTYRWNFYIARQIKETISQRVPSWQTAVWYRPTEDIDRQFTYHRRR